MLKHLGLTLFLIVATSCQTTLVRNSIKSVSDRIGITNNGSADQEKSEAETSKNRTQIVFKDREEVTIDNLPGYIMGADRVDVSSYRSRQPEPRAKTVPKTLLSDVDVNISSVLKNIANYLTDGIEDPFLQVKTLHDWVALTIAYDAKSYLSGTIPSQEVASVIDRKTAVCDGYAELLNELLKAADYKSIKISGYARGHGSSIFDNSLPDTSNHAWNAVFIDSNWYLIDSTWDSGHLDGRSFKRRYTTDYLFIDPQYMIFTHFPDSSRLQFLEIPVTADNYTNLPFIRGRFFNMGLIPIEGLSRVNTVQDRVSMKYRSPEGLTFSGILLSQEGKKIENRILIQNEDELMDFQVTFPGRGEWAVRLFAGTEGSGSKEWIADIGFQAESGTDDVFPKLYSPFFDCQSVIVSPEFGPLLVGDKQEIVIILPGYFEAFAKAGTAKYPMERDSEHDQFSVEIVIPKASEVTIFARRTARNRKFEGILSFPIKLD